MATPHIVTSRTGEPMVYSKVDGRLEVELAADYRATVFPAKSLALEAVKRSIGKGWPREGFRLVQVDEFKGW